MEIKISKCAAKCHVCGQDFAHEQQVHSAALMENDCLDRRDYCSGCVPERKDSSLFCSWQTQYSDPRVMESERQETLTPLRRLFYDLAGCTERLDMAQAFLAAQLLKRQKAFRQIRETEGGEDAARVTLFLDRAGGRLIETRDLNFGYSELDSARVLLLEKLRALESPEPPAESAPEPGEIVEETTVEPAAESGETAEETQQPSAVEPEARVSENREKNQ